METQVHPEDQTVFLCTQRPISSKSSKGLCFLTAPSKDMRNLPLHHIYPGFCYFKTSLSFLTTCLL